MICCCFARVWASSSASELLVNGEGHRCRWCIYSPSEAFRLLKSISCADKLTYWSKATKPRHLLVRQAWGHRGERKIVFLFSSPVGEGKKTLKLPAPKQHFFFLSFFLASATDSQQSGDFLQDARPWKFNFRLRDGKSTLRVADTRPTKLRPGQGWTRPEMGTGPWKRRRSSGRLDSRVLSAGVGTERAWSVQTTAPETATRHLLQTTVDKTWTSYRPSPSRRHVNFQRCAFQTKLEGGLRAECAASGLGNAARARLSILRTIMNNNFLKKRKENVDRRSGPTGERCAVNAASGAESFGCAAPCETCAESLTVLPAAARQHFQQHTCAFPATLLPVSAFSSFCFTGKVTGRWCGGSAAAQLLFCSDAHLSAD